MANTSTLVGEINSINQQITNRQNLSNIANDQLFGLLNNKPEKNLVIDGTVALHLQNMPNLLNVEQDINNIKTQFSQTAANGNINTVVTLNTILSSSDIQQKLNQTNQYIATVKNTINKAKLDIQQEALAQPNNSRNAYIRGEEYVRVAPFQLELNQYEQNKSALDQLLPIQQVWDVFKTIIGTPNANNNITTRLGEIKAINDEITNTFGINQNNFTPTIPAQTIGYNNNLTAIDLHATFAPNNNNPNINYELCNMTGELLTRNGSDFVMTLDGGQQITIKGLSLNNNQFSGANIQIEPIDQVKFPLNINFSVRGRTQVGTTGINLDVFKNFALTINAPQLDQPARQVAYDHLNTTNSVNQKIDSLYAANNTAREDDVIWEMLAAGGNKDEVEAARKDPIKSKEFIRRARASGIAIPVINLPNTYPNFRDYMTDEKRKVPVEHLVDGENFKNYLRNNLDKSIEEYLKKNIRTQIDIPNNRVKLLDAFIETNTVLTQGEREAAYNDLNTGNTINDRINIEHTNNNTDREDEVIREILGESGAKGEMEALRKDEAQAKEFIKKIRSLIHPPVIDIATLQSGFKAAMIDPTRKIPEEYLITQEKFKDYLATDLDKNIVDHLKKSIKKNLDIPANRGIIMRELLNFQTELKNNKIDSTVDQDALGDLAGVQMDSKRWLPLFGRKDKNYMRFFSGASVDLGSQTVNLNKEVKYGMNLKISGKNEIMATVKIGDKKEKTYKAGNPMAMIEKILKEKEIPEGKTRLHVAYNVIAGMIQIAKNEDISLSYRDAAGHNQVIKLDGKNIVLEDQDDLTNHATGRRNTTTLFDYSLFESTNSFEDPNRSGRHVLAPDNRTLRRGLEVLTKHFNVAMNQVNANYDCATERKMGGLLRSNTSSDFPASAWTSPIKKLLNCKTTTNFDFSTSVNHNGKSVQIERKKNTFFLTIDGVELKGKDLGKLLKKRKGGIRLFDGVERAICGEIYKNMVEKLRTNSKIARTSFGVMDPKTGRMYIVDEDGQLGYLRAEEAETEKSNLKKRPGVNTAANIAIAGGLGAAGIATGGAAALAAGLSWGAAGTAASWGAMTAPGVALFKDIRRIAGKGYGTLDHTPAARTMCDESETREIYKDPFLMGKLMKVMNLRLGQL